MGGYMKEVSRIATDNAENRKRWPLAVSVQIVELSEPKGAEQSVIGVSAIP